MREDESVAPYTLHPFASPVILDLHPVAGLFLFGKDCILKAIELSTGQTLGLPPSGRRKVE